LPTAKREGCQKKLYCRFLKDHISKRKCEETLVILFYAIIFFFFTSAWLESRFCAKTLAPFGFFKKASSFKKKPSVTPYLPLFPFLLKGKEGKVKGDKKDELCKPKAKNLSLCYSEHKLALSFFALGEEERNKE
jgi:hypothetical protein